MAKFAKLFDLEGDEQVLVVLSYDSNEEKYKVGVQTDLNEIRAIVEYGFDNEEKSIKCFEDYSFEDAATFLRTIEKTVVWPSANEMIDRLQRIINE